MKRMMLLWSGIFFFGFTFAHQPRLVFEQPIGQIVEVEYPEISQAFYGILSGHEDIYQIISDTGFLLYVNIVVPDQEGQRTDFFVDIQEGDAAVYTRLDGSKFQRKDFYEPFGGDAYLMGPTFEKQVGPGVYTIEVSNPDNQGKYSLAIGKIESFPFNEMVNTYKVMPTLKTVFFEKPRYTTFWNYVGLMLVVTGSVIGVGIRGIIKLVRYFRHRNTGL